MSAARGMAHRLVKALLAASGILCGVLVFHFVVMPMVVRQGSEAAVPDLGALALADSETRLIAAGLRLGEVNRVFHDQVSAGRVARQDPPAGSRVKKGREIHLVVSLGPEALRVPALAGESLEHARFLLQQAGLEPGRIRTVHTSEAARNCVVTSRPRPDHPLRGRGTVDLLISLGPPPARFLMPDLRGMEAREAHALLEEEGFQVRRRLWPGASAGGTTVVEQTPPPGYPIGEGGTVELITGG